MTIVKTRAHDLMRLLMLYAAALIGVALSGCVAPLTSSVSESRLEQSGRWRLISGIDVPCVRGIDGCGSQALAAVLAYYDPNIDAEALGEELPWHDDGATPVDLLLAARDRDFTAKVSRGSWEMLEQDVANDRPVLVMFDAAPEVYTITSRIPTTRVMHWGVVSGIALDGSQIAVASERARHHVIEREEFLKRWELSSNCRIAIGAADQ